MKQAKFWNRIAKRYAASPIADTISYEYKLLETQKLLSASMTVVEYGCGTGSTALIHAPCVAHIDAVDISESMLRIAEQKRLDANIENITFHQATIEGFKAPQESYDVAMAMSLLHLLSDKEQALAEIYSQLKPGGYFISSTIFMSEGFWFLRYVFPILQWFGGVPPVRFFKEKALIKSIEAAGFEIHQCWNPGVRKSTFIVAQKPGRLVNK